MFLALLELVRRQVIRVEQADPFGEISVTYVPPGERQVVEPPTSTPEEAAPERGDDAEAWQADELTDIEMPDVPQAEDAASKDAGASAEDESFAGPRAADP